jgi:predicted metal-dependent RNase
VFVVHGDPDAAAAFAERARRELKLDAHPPRYRETITLT